MHELDEPVRASLDGRHREFARRRGRAARYDPAVTAFAALPDVEDPQAWDDLAALSGGEAVALFATPPAQVPLGWRVEAHLRCVQMIETEHPHPGAGRDGTVVDLGTDDVPDMLDLIARTHPGPFLPRTVELGGYVGVREPGGRLIAMAGRRLATGTWREISAVCTDPGFRGTGLARRLIEVALAGIHAEGERAFLHAVETNPAIGLYRSMGFATRRGIDIIVVRPRP